MKAWRLNTKHEFELVEETRQPGENELKIKISKCGFSVTDRAIIEGMGEVYPIVPVRSAVGLVSETSGGLKLGERVVIDPYFSTDSEERSDKLKTKIRIMGVDADGLLADFVIVPRENIHVLPENVKDDEALFIESIAIAIKTIDRLKIGKGDYIAIIGATNMGIMLAQLAMYYQAIPILIDTNSAKLRIAEKFGIYYTVNSTLVDMEKSIMEITSGRLADHTVCDAKSMLPPYLALDFTKEYGHVAYVGYNRFFERDIKLSPVLRKQLMVVGVENGAGYLQTAINMLATKVIKTEGLIDKVASFDEVPEVAAEIVEFPLKYNKVVIDMDL